MSIERFFELGFEELLAVELGVGPAGLDERRRASPRSATRPSSSTRIWSASCTAEMRWLTTTIVRLAVVAAEVAEDRRLGPRVDGREGVVEEQDAGLGG